MVAHPDGRLGDYFATLRLLALRATPDTVLLPGHGEVGGSVREAVDRTLAHRVDRLEQVRRAVGAGATTADEVVAKVYAGLDAGLLPAALATVQAQLAYLATERR